MKEFLNKQFISKPKIQSVEKKKMFISLPYYGYLSAKIKNELESLLVKFFLTLTLT